MFPQLPSESLTVPPSFTTTIIPSIRPYLPSSTPFGSVKDPTLPYTTLTYASAVDGSTSLFPSGDGTWQRTVLSGSLASVPTHYLRGCHSAVLIGVSTAQVDDPSLNCRLEGMQATEGHGLWPNRGR
ncbi:hypothetical protein M501DRAFT_1049069 [Patellaria atrata CBS 101060]|uniref:2,5-diamino-6-ribosylamino-4(3H)-pyrimidinone 5'-phosphate reductase n=1 Tax=Patellaria atrata CBS 101060 TaxID=1346257 RepID=A0A9P4SCV2_9PEZI|nr:hypothetical protein M501DRAFT_1049069 [Patellaria atrata CBS 101060]